nr:hypothetical protein GCM10020093_009870 [Planobispora longispora]
MTMDVRYNPVLGWMFIVLGGIGAVLQIWLLLLGTFTVFIIFSIFFLIVGFLSSAGRSSPSTPAESRRTP